ncbi:PhnD/SsuA/transferrin family substrate-binding protein [Mameliella sp. CS4]|uniref:phosphate/phosphite/phosphonate ABC transporter substrate-binding protein n=1 Tax=Mameliella sp. CS4 TaxID=2862329 RepID=UPI001C5F3701|nr:PhnD/SsuA/transferrin family substrate-binding protein [Mameliella sp. CS4]MBW4984811.1 PhnD/SsuA/transferrin family substrate-binding protein [Mameliella sp. CS4]
MIASLPMYWREENARSWRDFWSCVQSAGGRHGLELPDLTPPDAIPEPWSDHWLRDDLAVSMTCGLPFRTVLKNRVTYVGTLGFGLNCTPGHYYSRVLRHLGRHDPRDVKGIDGLRLAYNSSDSQSGWAASQGGTPFARVPTYSAFVQTGSHAGSLDAVAQGHADIAFVDAVTWRLLKRFEPASAKVHVAGHTAATPGLPLIASRGTDPAPLRAALLDAVVDFVPQGDPYEMGGPLSFHVFDPQRYFDLPVPASPPT